MNKIGRANPSGFGAPFIRVYSGLGELTEFICNAKYLYSQKKDDQLSFTVKSTDPTTPDRPEFQEDAMLYVIWGYLNDTKLVSQKRTVYVRDVSCKFGPDGIEINIIATDKASYMRNNSTLGKNGNNSQSPDDIVKTLCEFYGLKNATPTFFEDGSIGLKAYPVTGITQSSLELQQQLGDQNSSQIDKARVYQEHFVQINDANVTGNRSDMRALKDIVEKIPDGPYIVEGRDDTISIRKRDFGQVPVRTYRYRSDDELIEFKPEHKTKHNNPKSSQITWGTANHKNKVHITGDVGEITDNNTRLAPIVKLTGQEPQVTVTNVETGLVVDGKGNIQGTGPLKANVSDTGSTTDGVNLFGPNLLKIVPNSKDPQNPNILIQAPTKQRSTPAFFANNQWTAAIDHTSVPYNPSLLLTAKQYVDLSGDANEAAALANNRRSVAKVEENPGEALMVGDPRIMSGMIIVIENASKKYSGNWYIEEVEHQLSDNAPYLIHCKLIRNGIGYTGNENNKSLSATVIGKPINKQPAVFTLPTRSSPEGAQLSTILFPPKQ